MRGPSRAVATQQATGRLLVNAALWIVVLVFGAPFVWIGALAFDREAGASWPWPKHPTFDNFRTLFDEMNAGESLRNSLFVVIATTLLAVVMAGLAGFGLSRIDWKRKGTAAFGLLLLYSFP